MLPQFNIEGVHFKRKRHILGPGPGCVGRSVGERLIGRRPHHDLGHKLPGCCRVDAGYGESAGHEILPVRFHGGLHAIQLIFDFVEAGLRHRARQSQFVEPPPLPLCDLDFFGGFEEFQLRLVDRIAHQADRKECRFRCDCGAWKGLHFHNGASNGRSHAAIAHAGPIDHDARQFDHLPRGGRHQSLGFQPDVAASLRREQHRACEACRGVDVMPVCVGPCGKRCGWLCSECEVAQPLRRFAAAAATEQPRHNEAGNGAGGAMDSRRSHGRRLYCEKSNAAR